MHENLLAEKMLMKQKGIASANSGLRRQLKRCKDRQDDTKKGAMFAHWKTRRRMHYVSWSLERGPSSPYLISVSITRDVVKSVLGDKIIDVQMLQNFLGRRHVRAVLDMYFTSWTWLCKRNEGFQQCMSKFLSVVNDLERLQALQWMRKFIVFCRSRRTLRKLKQTLEYKRFWLLWKNSVESCLSFRSTRHTASCRFSLFLLRHNHVIQRLCFDELGYHVHRSIQLRQTMNFLGDKRRISQKRTNFETLRLAVGDLKRREKMIERYSAKASLSKQVKLLRCAMDVWQITTSNKRSALAAMIHFAKKSRELIKSSYFDTWIANLSFHKSKQKRYHLFENIMARLQCKKKIKQCISDWSVQTQEAENFQIGLFYEKCRRRHIKESILRCWQEYSEQRDVIKRRIESRNHLSLQRLVKQTLKQWFEYLIVGKHLYEYHGV
eukprot:763837-Hanusia_phi.AAC.11